ncbi:hypothetical protein ACVGXS_03190, partial [Enterobacter hormaechei]
SKAIRHRKNNTLRLLPGGAGGCPGAGLGWPGMAAPPPHTKPQPKKKKLFFLNINLATTKPWGFYRLLGV